MLICYCTLETVSFHQSIPHAHADVIKVNDLGTLSVESGNRVHRLRIEGFEEGTEASPRGVCSVWGSLVGSLQSHFLRIQFVER